MGIVEQPPAQTCQLFGGLLQSLACLLDGAIMPFRKRTGGNVLQNAIDLLANGPLAPGSRLQDHTLRTAQIFQPPSDCRSRTTSRHTASQMRSSALLSD